MSIIWKLSRAARDSLSGRVGLSSAHCRDPMCSVSSLCSALWCSGSFSTAFFVGCTFKRFRNASWRAVRREMAPCLDDTSGSASMPSAIGAHSLLTSLTTGSICAILNLFPLLGLPGFGVGLGVCWMPSHRESPIAKPTRA